MSKVDGRTTLDIDVSYRIKKKKIWENRDENENMSNLMGVICKKYENDIWQNQFNM